MILLSDANVLMDLGHVRGLSALTQLTAVEVLDVVLTECHHHSQPGLVEEIRAAGVKEIKSQLSWLSSIAPDISRRLSLQDRLNFYYAQTFSRTLLTNERQLRLTCQAQGVGVHGTLWVIAEVHARQICPAESLCEWLDILSDLDRRLPMQEIAILKETLNCP
jgi:hypothetical protein